MAGVFCLQDVLLRGPMCSPPFCSCGLRSNAPGFNETDRGKALQLCDYVFLGFFTTEALLKVMALGLVMEPTTYLRNGAPSCCSGACRTEGGTALCWRPWSWRDVRSEAEQ